MASRAIDIEKRSHLYHFPRSSYAKIRVVRLLLIFIGLPPYEFTEITYCGLELLILFLKFLH